MVASRLRRMACTNLTAVLLDEQARFGAAASSKVRHTGKAK